MTFSISTREETPSPESMYVFDNAEEEHARRRFAGLPLIFDPGTIRLLSERGVGPGWRCLEVGGGGGSVAAWLAERVGPTGSVLVTDIDTRFLEAMHAPNLEVQRHDIATDPLPESTFDLVHARLVLQHIPARDEALARMAAALKPGGWLVVEDFDSRQGVNSVCPEPDLDPAEVPLKAHELIVRVMAAHGVDLSYARRVPARMHAVGLVDITAESRGFRWVGGSQGASVVRAGLEQLRAPILATGEISESVFEAELVLLDDPAFALPSPTMWATSGRRPAHA
jgi:SAM-dependent methyltransferase